MSHPDFIKNLPPLPEGGDISRFKPIPPGVGCARLGGDGVPNSCGICIHKHSPDPHHPQADLHYFSRVHEAEAWLNEKYGASLYVEDEAETPLKEGVSHDEFDSVLSQLESLLEHGRKIQAANNGREKARQMRASGARKNVLTMGISGAGLYQLYISVGQADWQEVLKTLQDVFPGASWHLRHIAPSPEVVPVGAGAPPA